MMAWLTHFVSACLGNTNTNNNTYHVVEVSENAYTHRPKEAACSQGYRTLASLQR